MRGKLAASSISITSLNTWRIKRFDEILYVLLFDEGELKVELSEFRLAIGAQVFVAETAGDLIVAIEARIIRICLNNCGDCGKRVELARMHAAGHQVIARAFGRGLGQDRRFDVLETARIEIATQRLHQLDARAHHDLHLGTAHVEVAVGHAHVFVGILVQREGQILRGVENLHRLGQQFDRAGLELVVGRQALADAASDTHTVLVTELAGDRESGGVFALDHHLGQALVIAQIDEGYMALQAKGVDPAAQGNGLADQRLIDKAAVVRAHALGTPGRPGGKKAWKRPGILAPPKAVTDYSALLGVLAGLLSAGAGAGLLSAGLVAAASPARLRFLSPSLLEVGLVPTAAGKPERRRTQLALHLRRTAAGAVRRIGIGQLLQPVKTMAAGAALEFIDRHGHTPHMLST